METRGVNINNKKQESLHIILILFSVSCSYELPDSHPLLNGVSY